MEVYISVYTLLTSLNYLGCQREGALSEVYEEVERSVSSNILCTARHMSCEGCQLVVDCGTLAAGQRCVLTFEPLGRIAGTVRWVVGDRAGFAFDEVMDRERQNVMKAACNGPDRIELTFV